MAKKATLPPPKPPSDISVNDDDIAIHLFEQEEQSVLEIGLRIVLDEDVRVDASTKNQHPRGCPQLKLRQFGSNDARWGIHSSVWDGGIALLHYVATHWEPVTQLLKQEQHHGREQKGKYIPGEPEELQSAAVVIDVGSGTGICGLGIAAMTQGRCAVAVTDLPEALPLLICNTALNASTFEWGNNNPPVVRELTWGVRPAWLHAFINATFEKQEKQLHLHSPCRVLILGADIVYRPSLFAPLLTTLLDLHKDLDDIQGVSSVEIWLSCQSVRSYLNDFWETAADFGFQAQFLAISRLDNDYHNKTDLATVVVESVSDDCTLPSASTAKGHGVNWIVSLARK